jgi:hypothetical protein
MSRPQGKRWLYRCFLVLSILGFLGSGTAVALAILGLVAGLWGLLGMLAIPVSCVFLFIALVGEMSPEASRPSIMQMFASGGRN